MSLKNEYNAEIRARNYKKIPTELQSVDCLLSVLQNGKYPFVRVKKVHGNYIRFHTGNGRIKREICDMFLILRYKDHYRFSFIQNKRQLTNYQTGLSDFKIDSGQHYFLVKKPDFLYKQKTYTLLKGTKYDTVTAYSVFYQGNNGAFNFDFSSAISCICSKRNAFCCCNFTEKCIVSHQYNKIQSKNETGKLIDFVALSNADEIENHPYFGEVVYDSDTKMKQLQNLIKDCAGQDFLDFLEMNTNSVDYIPENNDLATTDLIIKNLIAVDCRELNHIL